MPYKISAVVIAYNDAPNMRRCLDSLHWVDEIVVVDSHSTDGTTEICLEYTDKVFQYPFHGFGALRNQAITHATHDWILAWIPMNGRHRTFNRKLHVL